MGIRKNFLYLTSDERDQFFEALLKMKAHIVNPMASAADQYSVYDQARMPGPRASCLGVPCPWCLPRGEPAGESAATIERFYRIVKPSARREDARIAPAFPTPPAAPPTTASARTQSRRRRSARCRPGRSSRAA
jgi:hypothetical protein